VDTILVQKNDSPMAQPQLAIKPFTFHFQTTQVWLAIRVSVTGSIPFACIFVSQQATTFVTNSIKIHVIESCTVQTKDTLSNCVIHAVHSWTYVRCKSFFCGW